MKRVMLDLETLGKKPGCAVISIGACTFGDVISSEFYVTIDSSSLSEAGLSADLETVEWWMQQDEEARAVFKGGDTDLEEALAEFQEWFPPYPEVEVWANGPDFDCKILRGAFEAVGMEAPWHFTQQRCCRTLDSLVHVRYPEREGTHHNALDDAKHQARVVEKQLAELDIIEPGDL